MPTFTPRSVAETVALLPSPPGYTPLPAPAYTGPLRAEVGATPSVFPPEKGPAGAVGLAVPSMASHTTDEGWQLFRGLHSAGVVLQGKGMHPGGTNVRAILQHLDPRLVIVQDQREWEGMTAGPGFDRAERFTHVGDLRARPDIFTVTVLKDAQHNPAFHRDSAATMGAHAWVTYYHPLVVSHLAPYVRREHLVRTVHTLDADTVPPFLPEKKAATCLLSGAVSGAYPLRQRLFAHVGKIPGGRVLKHPGYGRSGCRVGEYLAEMSKHRVAVCTSSRYGYTLRKIVEATACGCAVITDLPVDDVMPGIDGNLYRVHPDAPLGDITALVSRLYAEYDPRRQGQYAAIARDWYDYRAAGARLLTDILNLAKRYP